MTSKQPLKTSARLTPKGRSFVATSILSAAVACALPLPGLAQTIRVAIGATAANATLVAARDQFRLDLGGGTSASANGSFGGLRREINWDGVPAASAAPNTLAANFFNTTSPRGVVFSTTGNGFEVSGATTDAGVGQPAAANFGNINATYTATFAPFSPQRLFTSLNSNVIDVSFFLPGTVTAATVKGFGVMFSDVDLFGGTTIQLFDSSNNSLGTFNAPAQAGSQGFSFVGVSFPTSRIGRARITSGNAALAAGVNDGGAADLVVLDDFIYSEPVPEPSALLLLSASVPLLLRCRRA
jgi:hypothetical protein